MVIGKKVLSKLQILQCPLEQKPLKFQGFTVKKQYLQVPNTRYSFDYSFLYNGKPNNIRWERKSASDAISTFTQGRERFVDKLLKSQALGLKVYLILEYDYRSAFSTPLYSKASRKILYNAPLSWAMQGLCVPLFVSNRTGARNCILSSIEAWIKHTSKIGILQ